MMSGTSMDGLDLALCRFAFRKGKWEYEITAAECIPYPESWLQKLASAKTLQGYELIKLHTEYGFYIGGLCNELLSRTELNAELISSHGHTIFHNPAERVSFALGDGAAISAITALPVVCDVRSMDVCLGGQGAPLVPIGDELFFKDYDVCLNLGGIANISYNKDGMRLAYDVCPCNLLLNYYAQKEGFDYDAGGGHARKGVFNPALNNALDSGEYYKRLPPKSLDKDELMAELLPLIDSFGLSNGDILATLIGHIKGRIFESIDKIFKNKAQVSVFITGGGAFNNFLIERMQEHKSLKTVIPDEQNIKFKEALIFAFLGLLRVLNKPNSLASVTGASRDSLGGALYGG
jgi:anhydro-N-acetylmuramic acid kinase